ncbi:MAG: CBS domain-containing protein [Chloroflexi bacterium]|nr:CBS domain-containing protein [Chloroflexota bacterium]
MAGKSDWALEGLPLAGRSAGRRRALDVMRQPATCGPDATLGEARALAGASGDPLCAVVDASGVLLGRVDGDALDGDPAARVGDVMEPQPPTEKPDTFLHSLAERLGRNPHPSVLVTSRAYDEGGRLLGALYREDVERVLAENAALASEG